ncbi:transketolase [bacterium]|nr:transketolase [bacterium]
MQETLTVETTFGAGKTGAALDQLCVDTIRALSMDGVEAANSGHPGMPMGMADVAHVLWTEFLALDPKDPHWPGRDRFVLSAGHGSMLLYSLLHLSGFGLTQDDLRQFRQCDSKTPGHPESFMTTGVETTTGPLGQGFGNGVGMAIAERNLAARYDASVVAHRTFAIVSDGDLMEGVASEAASLAGHQALGRLVYLWDDNHISIDGSTDLAFSEDVLARFRAYGWRTARVDGNDRAQVRAALADAVSQEEKPTLIACRTIIGRGAPTKQGTAKAHGSPLGKDEVKKTKELMGWPLEPTFLVPQVVRERWNVRQAEWQRARSAWDERLLAWRKSKPDEHALWSRQLTGALPSDLEQKLPVFEEGKAGGAPIATRAASGIVLNAVYPYVPGLIGGSADLTESNSTHLKEASELSRTNRAGRYIHFGVREHAMGSILNGLSLHGGFIPFGGTFLIFSDYMRGAIRLAALSHLRAIYVLTHDSIFLGEDGPTHQPIEHMAALRAIPNLVVLRPGDAQETAWSWKIALERAQGPTALVLTRQKLPVFDRNGADPVALARNTERGGYVLWQSLRGAPPDLVIIATGSELSLALDSARKLATEDAPGRPANVRVVSMPSAEIFAEQDEDYRRSVIPRIPARVAIEAARMQGWERWIGEDGLAIGMNGFGSSGTDKQLAEKFGFTVPQVCAKVRAWFRGLSRPAR